MAMMRCCRYSPERSGGDVRVSLQLPLGHGLEHGRGVQGHGVPGVFPLGLLDVVQFLGQVLQLFQAGDQLGLRGAPGMPYCTMAAAMPT